MARRLDQYGKEKQERTSGWMAQPVILTVEDEEGVLKLAEMDPDTGAIKVSTTQLRNQIGSPYQRNYALAPISDLSWIEILSATSANITRLHIFDSNGYPVRLGIGAIGAETEIFRISPGGDGVVDLSIPVGSRLSVRAAEGEIIEGTLIINFLS